MMISSICWKTVILICFLLIELVISVIIFEDIFNSNKPWVRTLGWILAAIYSGCDWLGILEFIWLCMLRGNYYVSPIFFSSQIKGPMGVRSELKD